MYYPLYEGVQQEKTKEKMTKHEVNPGDFNDYQIYVESGICPNCSGQLERIWDRVSDDPILDECTEIVCKKCPWKDNK